MIEAIGFFLFLAIGTNYCMDVSNLPASSPHAARAALGALGGICVIIAAIFLVDFFLSIAYRRR